MGLEPGLTGEVTLTVAEADTASALLSGDVPVLATPRLVALAEAATVAAIRDHLGPGETSVGTSVTLDHRAASPIGAVVVAHARLVEVDGRRLTFTAEARELPATKNEPAEPAEPAEQVESAEPARVVATARIERVVVDRARFLARLAR